MSGQRAESSGTDRVAVGANGFHCLAPAPGVHLLQDSMNVITHRKLRKVQVRSDFLIGDPFGDESNQLLLAQSKIRLWGPALDRVLFDHMSNETEEGGTKLRRADGLAAED